MSSVREYPPKPITGNTTTMKGASYGNGLYKASASSVWGEWEPWKALSPYDKNKVVEQGAWHSENLINDGNTGYKSVPEWIQLQLPRPIRLHKYIIRARANSGGDLHKRDFPDKFKVKGSNNGTSWTVVDTRDNIAKTVSTQYEAKEFIVSKSKPYKYFRLEVEEVGVDGIGRGTNNNGTIAWTGSYAVISGLSFFGEEEKENKTIWNPLGDGFWSAGNTGMWTYIGVVALLILGLMYAFMM